jgi:hypothetical protein
MSPQICTSRRLDPEARAPLEACTSRSLPLSDLSYWNLVAWGGSDRCVLSFCDDGNLVVRMPDYLGGPDFFTFLGTSTPVEMAKTLLAAARQEELLPWLPLIHEDVVAAGRWPPTMTVEPDEANFDYVVDLVEWAELKGGSWREHRKKVSTCRRRYRLEFRTLALPDSRAQTDIFALFDRWVGQRRPNGVAAVPERQALRRLLCLGSDERLMAWGLYDGSLLVGFAICEGVPNSPYSLHHFSKTDRTYDGAASYLMHLISHELLDRGFTLGNIAQDLGLPGLREAKQSWNPCQYLRKFIITE